jgi:hypothetical protein
MKQTSKRPQSAFQRRIKYHDEIIVKLVSAHKLRSPSKEGFLSTL